MSKKESETYNPEYNYTISILKSTDQKHYIIGNGNSKMLSCDMNDNDLSDLIVDDITQDYLDEFSSANRYDNNNFSEMDGYEMELFIKWTKTSDKKVVIIYNGIYVCDDTPESFKSRMRTLIDMNLTKRLIMTDEEKVEDEENLKMKQIDLSELLKNYGKIGHKPNSWEYSDPNNDQ